MHLENTLGENISLPLFPALSLILSSEFWGCSMSSIITVPVFLAPECPGVCELWPTGRNGSTREGIPGQGSGSHGEWHAGSTLCMGERQSQEEEGIIGSRAGQAPQSVLTVLLNAEWKTWVSPERTLDQFTPPLFSSECTPPLFRDETHSTSI